MQNITNLTSEEQSLVNKAVAAQADARALSSRYKVGCAILTKSGKTFSGCNVETTHYLVTHAERNAVDTMVANGHSDIALIAVVTADASTCCGMCRQDIWEFAQGDSDLPILFSDGESTHFRTTIGQLLPHPFPKSKI